MKLKQNFKEVALEFALPDFKKEDISVRVSKNSVAIRASKKYESRVQKKGFFHAEKSSSAFNYITTIPQINPDKAKIEFKSGVLKISAPKA